MPTYRQILRINEKYALDNGKEPSSVKRLLMHYANLDHTKLINNMNKTMSQTRYQQFLRSVDEYIIKNRPVQHITENEYFYGYEFKVNGDVMIPRFETEELVDYTLEYLEKYFPNHTHINVLDIGTGSGCLAITLAKENSRVIATGTEISDSALFTAKRNRDKLDADVTFHEGNLIEPVKDQTFDVIISNPPYIPNNEKLEAVVKDYEPSIALYGGKDGLDFYRKMIPAIKPLLNKEFLIAFEHASHHNKALKKLFKQEFKNIQIFHKKDMQGKDRMTFVKNK